MSTGHGHCHGAAQLRPGRTSLRVRRILWAVTLPLLLANILAPAVMWPHADTSTTSLSSPAATPALLAAVVTGLDFGPCTAGTDTETGVTDCNIVAIRITGGADKGSTATFTVSPIAGIRLQRGNRIYVDRIDIPAADGTTTPTYGFYEFRRETPLLLLGLAFAVVAVLVGRRQGIRALLALVLSLGVLIKFMLPAIIDGRSPLLVALVGASAVMFLALYLSHGVNTRTTTAVLGTVASLGITGLLATLAVNAAHFTGLSGEESSYVRATAGQIDLRGLLLAGIIIGALGVLDDVTVTQASAVWELHHANPTGGSWPHTTPQCVLAVTTSRRWSTPWCWPTPARHYRF